MAHTGLLQPLHSFILLDIFGPEEFLLSSSSLVPVLPFSKYLGSWTVLLLLTEIVTPVLGLHIFRLLSTLCSKQSLQQVWCCKAHYPILYFTCWELLSLPFLWQWVVKGPPRVHLWHQMTWQYSLGLLS